ncbi:MAG: Tol-Pal system subunit TolQ, partial [Pseudomonadota bacterium]|nr:Tol-Pal system subunit TolQ [Pseudomonadota bacterium]
MEQAVLEGAVGQALGHSQMSLTSLLLGADWVVKTVMLILLVASVWCWAIIFDKTLRFRRLQKRANKFEDEFWSGGSLEELYDR